jgi:hypothetical protein
VHICEVSDDSSSDYIASPTVFGDGALSLVVSLSEVAGCDLAGWTVFDLHLEGEQLAGVPEDAPPAAIGRRAVLGSGSSIAQKAAKPLEPLLVFGMILRGELG